MFGGTWDFFFFGGDGICSVLRECLSVLGGGGSRMVLGDSVVCTGSALICLWYPQCVRRVRARYLVLGVGPRLLVCASLLSFPPHVNSHCFVPACPPRHVSAPLSHGVLLSARYIVTWLLVPVTVSRRVRLLARLAPSQSYLLGVGYLRRVGVIALRVRKGASVIHSAVGVIRTCYALSYHKRAI